MHRIPDPYVWGTTGRRPHETKRDGSKYVISFYPQTKNAKNHDVVLFRLTITKQELKKLAKVAEGFDQNNKTAHQYCPHIHEIVPKRFCDVLGC